MQPEGYVHLVGLGREIIDESDAVADMQELARAKNRERLDRIEDQDDEDASPG